MLGIRSQLRLKTKPTYTKMKKAILLLILFITFNGYAQNEMTQEKLDSIYTKISDSIEGSSGRWQFKVKDVVFIAISDSTHNRMRIISPIVETFKLTETLKEDALVANFHTALDVKYAISDDILWSVFIHPLKELSEDQVYNAVKQVYFANITFGTSFSSTSLVFPGREQKTDKEEEPKNFIKRKI